MGKRYNGIKAILGIGQGSSLSALWEIRKTFTLSRFVTRFPASNHRAKHHCKRMRNLTLVLALLASLCTQIRAQTPFSETYFSAKYPKPTGDLIKYIRTPKLLYIHASTPYTSPIKRDGLYALNPEGQRVWHSFDWDFDPQSELTFSNILLAADGSLYILVQEVINASILQYSLIRVHGGSGAVLWKYPIPANHTGYQIVEGTPGEISIVYFDKNAIYNHYLRTLSAQDGSVLRNHYLARYYVTGIAADAAGNFVFVAGDSISKINGLDPTLAYWRMRMPPPNNSSYDRALFTFNPDGETAVFWGGSSSSLYYQVEAVINLNTGAAKITQTKQIGGGYSEVERVLRGDTVFICRYNNNSIYYSKFALEAYRVSDGKLLYENGYDIIDPATGKPYNDYSLSRSMDMDQEGNLYLVGRSCKDKGLGIMSVVKARASDGVQIWNKTVDITPADKDLYSYGRIAWCPPSNNKLWLAGMIQVNPKLKSPVLFELDKNTAAPIQTIKLGGTYDHPSGTLQFLPVDDGYCALVQLDNCAAVYRYDAAHQPLWKKELCQEQLVKAGGLYKGLNNSLFVTGANHATPSPTGLESPLKVDSLLLYRLDVNTGNVQRIWKFPAPDGGYPIHVAGLSDTIRYFVHANGYRRAYRIINNLIQTAGSYQSSTDPVPLLPLKTTYVQRGRETVGVLSKTQYMVWFPNTKDGTSYNYPATTGSVQVSCIAAMNGSREMIAAGKNSTTSGYGLFRFKTGASTLLWQNSAIGGIIQRILNVQDSTLYTAGCSGDQLYVFKFSAKDGHLFWQKVFTITNNKPEINDLVFDTTSGRLLLCGSIADLSNQRMAWLLQLDSTGAVKGQIRRAGDSSGPSNRAFCVQNLSSGEFLVGGQMQRIGLDTAAFIWNGIPGQFFSATGRVYCDLNNNNQQDTGEPAYRQTVSVSPGAYNSFPDAAGVYRADVLATGSYEAGVLLPSPHYSVKKAAFSIQANQSNVSGADIRLTPLNVNNKVLDAAVVIAEITPARFGFETSLSVSVQNLGSLLADSLLLELDCGSHFELTGLQLSSGGKLLHPLQLSNGALQALLKSPDVLQQYNFVAKGTLDTFLLPGDSLLCTARLSSYPANEVAWANNFDTLILVVQGAYDPNDLTAYPSGGVRTSSLAADGSLDLGYRIRFENTGNANTEFLRVVVEYSPLLRPETFRLGAASAPCTVRFLEGRRMEFSFPQYALSPAALDSIGSKGYVFYHMRTVADLVVGDTIKNRAGIYFDFNPPILTNTAQTWIENTGNTAIGDPAESRPAFLLYPNPVKTGSLVRFSSALPASERWQMFSTDGVLVAEGRVAGGISAPAPGVYRVVCRNLAQSLVVVR